MTASDPGHSDGPTAEGLRALADVARDALQDAATERRRLRRRVFWWRAIAAGLIVVLIVGAFASGAQEGRDHIARVEVLGVILDDRDRDAMMAQLAKDERVKAVIVRIDSPGGTTVGGEALYETLRGVAEEKPVVAVMGQVAASAGYIAAIAADHVVARGNTITASIGVILTAPNFSGALDHLGVEVVEVKSGPQKAEPSPYQPIDEGKLEAERVLIDDSFEWFIGLVRERRDLNAADLDAVGDGRVLTGRMALERRLVDEIGGEREAIAWLEAERDVLASLPVIDHAPQRRDGGFFDRALDDVMGIGDFWPIRLNFLQGPVLVSTAG